MSDPYEGMRRNNCSRVIRDLRIAEDQAGHEARERAFEAWLNQKSWMRADVNLWTVCIGMRVEWQR